MKNAVAIIGGVLVLAGIAGILALRDRGDGPGPEKPAPAPEPLAETPAPAGSPFEILCRRSRDEILVFARRREFGRPAVGLEVRLLDAAGTVLRIGRTDEFGVLRAAVPEGAASIACGMGESFVASDLPPPPPPAAAPPLPILADRTVVRPGDVVRFCVWAEGRPEGVLTVEPADPAVEPETFSRVEELQAGFPGPRERWILLEARIPGHVRPGMAVVNIGEARLEIPILPRYGPAFVGGPKSEGRPLAARPPAPVASPGDLRVELVDDAWHVECREEFSVALLYATSGDRFLTHGAVPGEGKDALAALFLEDEEPGERIVHAVVSTARGFLEASVSAPEPSAAGRRLRVDPEPRVGAAVAEDRIRAFVEEDGRTVPAALAVAVEDPSGTLPEAFLATEDSLAVIYAHLALASGGDRQVRVLAVPRDGGPPLRAETTVLGAEPTRPPEGPAWVYEGDSIEKVAVPPKVRQATMYIERFVRIGESPPFVEEGVTIPPHAKVHWKIGPTDRAAAIRMRAGEAIVLETETGDEPKSGLLDADLLAGGSIRVESSIPLPEKSWIRLECEVPILPAAVPPRSQAGLGIKSDLPERVAAGSVIEASLHVAANPGPTEESLLWVVFRLPAGAVPAEDCWSVRERAPAGADVLFRDGEVVWTFTRLKGPATLTMRLRFPWKGRFGVPPATALFTGPGNRESRTAGAVVVVE